MGALKRGMKNAFRNTVRSVGVIVILGVAVALSISMLIARQAVTTKITQVRSTTGTAITVSPAGFFGGQGGGTPLTNAQANKMLTIPNVASIKGSYQARLNSSETSLTSSIQFGGALGGAGGPGGFGQTSGGAGSSQTFTPRISFTGTNSPSDALTGGANGGGTEKLTAGAAFAPNSSANVAIVGSSIATANSLKVGSTFTAWSTTITVIGIYDAGSQFANNGVLMPLATVQKLAGAAGELTSITVDATSIDHVDQVTADLKKQLGSAADVTSEEAQVAAQLSPLNSVKTISTYTLVGSVIAAAVILLLSMLMIVRERRREIGVLKAIGAPTRSVIGQFVAESSTFTVLGSLLGLVAGVLLASPITNALVSSNSTTTATGFGGFGGFGGGFRPGAGGGSFGGGGTFTPPSGGSFQGRGQGAGFFGFHGVSNTLTQVHAAAGVGTLVFAFAAALVIAGIASAMAASMITRVRPAEVLRSE